MPVQLTFLKATDSSTFVRAHIMFAVHVYSLTPMSRGSWDGDGVGCDKAAKPVSLVRVHLCHFSIFSRQKANLK